MPDPTQTARAIAERMARFTMAKLEAHILGGEFGADDASLWDLNDASKVTVFTILLDPSKTNADFDWRTTTPLVEGVAKTIQYYKEYLAKVPNAAKRTEIEASISRLESALASGLAIGTR